MKPLHAPLMADPAVSKQRADDLISWLRAYAEERIDSRLFDERRCVPPFVILDFGNHGIFGLQVPEKFGGLALRNRDYLRILEQLAAIDISLASLVFIHNANGIRPLVGYATPAQQAELLPILASGREIASFALTEPAAGSNVPGIETIAIPQAKGGWRLRGVKRWNGSGWAGVVCVFAKVLDEKGKPRHMTGFVVRQSTPGVRVGPESLTMGVRSIMQNSIIFDDVLVQPAQVLGQVDKGMEVADEALLVARLSMGAVCLGGMKRCSQLMHRYASRRTVSTGRLFDSPISLAILGELTVKITLLQTLIDQLAEVMDQGAYPPEEACMIAKIVSTNFMWEAADALVEMLGGRGYMENNIAPQIMRDCRMLRIGEGANELMTLSVGRRVLHSEPLHNFINLTLEAPEVSARLKQAALEIQARCLAASAPFPDRTSAITWAHSLIGQVAVQGLLVAIVQYQQRRTPTANLRRAQEWAMGQYLSMLDHALTGLPNELFVRGGHETAKLIEDYAQSIGDLEQCPPGVEEAIDPLLRRDPESRGRPMFTDLPGNARPAAEPTISPLEVRASPTKELSPGEKRKLAARLLSQRLKSDIAQDIRVS